MTNETAERIVSGASELFFEYGFSKITVDEIANHVGLTKKTVYNHFPTKLAIMVSVIETNVGSILKGLASIAAAKSLDFFSKMERMMEFIYHELGMKRLTFFESFQQYYIKNHEKPVQVIKERIISLIEQLIGESEQARLIKPGVKKSIIPYIYINMLYGLVGLYKDTRVPVHPGELLVESMKSTFFGILNDPGKQALKKRTKMTGLYAT